MQKKIPLTPTPVFHNVQVIVEHVGTGGNADHGNYEVSCAPYKVVIHQTNAVISYQLVHPTPPGITFVGLQKRSNQPVPQLSPVSISYDGRLMVFADSNSEPALISTTLLIQDGTTLFEFDPEVGNEPNKGLPDPRHDQS